MNGGNQESYCVPLRCIQFSMEHARKLRRGRETLPAKAIVPDDGARISFRDWERQVSPGIR